MTTNDEESEPTVSLILRAPLMEMAIARGALIGKIEALAPQIISHLVKLAVVVHRERDRAGWVVEISGWLKEIVKWKIGGGKTDFDFYIGPLWTDFYADDPARNVGAFVQDLKRAKPPYPVDEMVKMAMLVKAVSDFMVGAATIMADKQTSLEGREERLREFTEEYEQKTRR